jgi:hypothetical protein
VQAQNNFFLQLLVDPLPTEIYKPFQKILLLYLPELFLLFLTKNSPFLTKKFLMGQAQKISFL